MIKGKKNLRWYYNRKSIVCNYDTKRFNDTFRRLQHEVEVEIINKAISNLKNPKVLEIAVGTGRITKEIKANGTGIDTSENMLRIAKKSAPGWKFIKMDVMELKFREQFNAVVSFRLLRHFDKKDRKIALKKINNALSANGLLIFDMPTGYHSKILEFIDIFKKHDKIFEADTPVEEIKKELNKCGFDVLKIYNTKSESLFFKGLCIINDKLNLFYTLLKKHMEKQINDIKFASNAAIIAKKSS